MLTIGKIISKKQVSVSCGTLYCTKITQRYGGISYVISKDFVKKKNKC